MLANVTRRFGSRSGAVIFSGMGGDGSISGPQMVEAGGFIWAQTADTCASLTVDSAGQQTAVLTAGGQDTSSTCWGQ